jgi:hypothetical protein
MKARKMVLSSIRRSTKLVIRTGVRAGSHGLGIFK